MPSRGRQPQRDECEPLIAANGNGNGHGHGDTLFPLAHDQNQTSSSDSLWSRTKQNLNADIDTRWSDLVLIVCFFMAGLIDSGAYNAYECFVSLMTGNTIFAALGISHLPKTSPKYAYVKSVASLVAYFAGTLVFATFHRYFGQRKRWTLFVSFMMQTILTAISAGLVLTRNTSESGAKPHSLLLPQDPGFPWLDLVPISLLSFQASGKVLASRLLQFSLLPTLVLQMLYSDLLADPGLFTAGLLQNGPRNRRFGGIVFYFAGAVSGGAMAKSHVGFSGALCLAAAMNLAISCLWLVWRADKGSEQDDG